MLLKSLPLSWLSSLGLLVFAIAPPLARANTGTPTAVVELVADIAAGVDSSLSRTYVPVDNDKKLLFSANNGVWMLSVNPRDGSTDLSSLPDLPTYTNAVAFYEWNDITYILSGSGLFAYDPTAEAEGRVAVTLLNSVVSFFSSSVGPTILPFKDKLYMSGYQSGFGTEVWCTDGTSFGTQLFYDFDPGSLSSYPRALEALGSRLLILFYDEIWVSDGSSTSTTLFPILDTALDRWTFSALGNAYAVFQDRIFFSGRTTDYGYEVWYTDGSIENTTMLVDLNVGTASSTPTNLAVVQDETLIFFAYNASYQTNLFASDGTALGTKPIWDPPGSYFTIDTDTGYTEYLHWLVFISSEARTSKIYKTDGTEEGSGLLADISPWVSPRQFTAMGDKLYFFADLGDRTDLWVSNGIPEGTMMHPAVWKNSIPAFGLVYEMVAFNGQLYFTTNNATTGYELWNLQFFQESPETSAPEPLDETAVTVELVRDINPGFADSKARAFTAFKDSVVFAADNTPLRDTYFSNGTEAGTRLLPLGTGYYGSTPYVFMEYKEQLLVLASTGIFLTNGTESETIVLNTDFIASSNSEACEFNGRVYMLGYGSLFKTEIWVTDGTVAGTKLFLDGLENPRELMATDSYLFFLTNQVSYSTTELWSSDGTVEGSTIIEVEDLTLQLTTTEYIQLVPSPGNAVCFRAEEIRFGSEVWCTNGTEAGTWPLVNVNPGDASSNPRNFGVFEERVMLVFFATYENYDYMFASNGTTTWFLSWSPPRNYFRPSEYVEFQGHLFFTENSYSVGTSEIYMTDVLYNGTTGVFTDLFPWTNIRNMVPMGNKLYFLADYADVTSLWCTDGTEEGTIEVPTKWPNNVRAFSTVAEGGYGHFLEGKAIVPFNGDLYFAASNGTTGLEPWRAVLSSSVYGPSETMSPSNSDSELSSLESSPPTSSWSPDYEGSTVPTSAPTGPGSNVPSAV